MKVNKGFGAVWLLVIVTVAVALVAVVFLLDGASVGLDRTDGNEVGNEEAFAMAEEPVSQESDLETIELELEATLVGDVEQDIEGLEVDAGEL